MVVPITRSVVNWQPQPQSSTFQNRKQMNWLHNGLRIDSGALSGSLRRSSHRNADTGATLWQRKFLAHARWSIRRYFFTYEGLRCAFMIWVILFIWCETIEYGLFSAALPPWYLLRKSTYIIGSNFKLGFDSSKNLHDSCQQMRDQMVLYVYKYANMKDNISMPIGYCRFPYRKKIY